MFGVLTLASFMARCRSALRSLYHRIRRRIAAALTRELTLLIGEQQRQLETLTVAVTQTHSEQHQEQAVLIRGLGSLIRDFESLSRQSGVAHTNQLGQMQFETARRLDDLRRLTAGLLQPTLAQKTPVSAGHVSSPGLLTCRICSGPVDHRWNAPVLNDRYVAAYHECRCCHSLQILEPTWLEEAYACESKPLAWTGDMGRYARNFSEYCYLRSLREAGVLPAGPRLLDFGGGYGLLTQMLFTAGLDAWQSDPYVSMPFFAQDRFIADLETVPAGSFDIVTSFEVFEHLLQPLEIGRSLKRLLRPDGFLMISTGVYQASQHGPDWPYLAREGGQHITFWSRQALSHFAHQLGFSSVGYWPNLDGVNIVFSSRPVEQLQQDLARGLSVLTGAGFLDRICRPWELSNFGIAYASSPLTTPARSCEEKRAKGCLNRFVVSSNPSKGERYVRRINVDQAGFPVFLSSPGAGVR